MATIISAQSGVWSDTTTWVGGVVPIETDDIIISEGHIVSISSSVSLSGNVHISTTAELILGLTGYVLGELILNGCTIEGEGSLKMQTSSIKSTDNWSYIKCANLTVIPTSNSLTFTSWDFRNITFEGVANINMYLGARIIPDMTAVFVTENLVFKDCGAVRFHRGGSSPNPKRANIKKCTFINSAVTCSSIAGEYFFEKCVFYNKSSGKSITIASNSAQQSSFKECIFLNNSFTNINTVMFEDCYAGFDIASEGGGYLYGLNKAGVSVTNCIGYAGELVDNNRAFSQGNITGSFLEDRSASGSNSFIASGNVNWTNNILLSETDGFTSVVSETSISNYNISNNTRVGSIFSTLERNTPLEGSVITYKNNLHTSSSSSPRFIQTINGMPNPYTIDVDYNHSYNPTVWVADPLVNGTGENNISETDNTYPMFVEERTHDTLATTLGGTSYTDVWEYFRGLNGYSDTSNTHSEEPLSDTVVADTLTYFKEGYAPTNMALATAGEEGTYIGAMMPVAAPSATVSLSSSPDTIKAGEFITYTATLSNVMPTDVDLIITANTDELPLTIVADTLSASTKYQSLTEGTTTASVKGAEGENITPNPESSSTDTPVTERPTTGFTSIKSGNWSDPTVWESGLVPIETDIVTINVGHTITVDSDVGNYGGLSNKGSLIIADNSVLTIGLVEPRTYGIYNIHANSLTKSEGNGKISFVAGTIQTIDTSPTARAKVSCVILNATSTNKTGKIYTKFHYVDFYGNSDQTTGMSLTFFWRATGTAAGTFEHGVNEIDMLNCTFTNIAGLRDESGNKVVPHCAIRYGESGWTSTGTFKVRIENCDFREVDTMYINGNCDSTVESWDFIGNTMASTSSDITTKMFILNNGSSSGVPINVKKCFYNDVYVSTVGSYGWGSISNSQVLLHCEHNIDFRTGLTMGTNPSFGNTNVSSTLKNGISFFSETTSNPHPVSCFNVDGYISEAYPSSMIESNHYMPGCRNITNSLVIGEGDFFSFVGSWGNSVNNEYNFINNTFVNNYDSATHTYSSMLLAENITNYYDPVVNLHNNLVYKKYGETEASYVRTNMTATTQLTPTLTYNASGNNDVVWTNSSYSVLGDQATNIIVDDIGFVDDTRGLRTATTDFLGYNGEVVGNALATPYGMTNGYDNSGETPTQNPSIANEYAHRTDEIVDWIKQGYVPTNMALATAGKDGTYIGAMMPVPAQVGTLTFNGVELTAATFNGRALNSIVVNGTEVINFGSKDDGVLKVLSIGSSFSQDVQTYMIPMSKGLGIDTYIANAYIAGGAMSTHHDNLTNNTAAYQYQTKDSINGPYNFQTPQSLQSMFAKEEWDIITFQSWSAESGLYDSNAPYLQDLIDAAKQHCPNKDVKFMWHQTWAYADNSTHSAFPTYDNDQMTMYNAIVDTSSRILADFNDIVGIIPCGTSIQNSRTYAELEASGNQLTTDGYHLNPSGDVIAGYTFLAKTANKNIADFNFDTIMATEGFNTDWTSELDVLAREAVSDSLTNPNEVTPDSRVPIDPPVDEYTTYTDFTVSNGYCSNWTSAGATVLRNGSTETFNTSATTPTIVSSTNGGIVLTYGSSKNPLFLPAGTKLSTLTTNAVRMCYGATLTSGQRYDQLTTIRTVELPTDSYVFVNIKVSTENITDPVELKNLYNSILKIEVPTAKLSQVNNNEG